MSPLLPSARLLPAGAVFIAGELGCDELISGLTIVPLGTSLPELAICVAGTLRRERAIAIGNVIGASPFDLLGVYAIPGLLGTAGGAGERVSQNLPRCSCSAQWRYTPVPARATRLCRSGRPAPPAPAL